MALLTLTDYIRRSLDLGHFVGSVFLDFTKAFDTINHNVLFTKLQSIGISGPALNMLKSYLSNRELTVYAGGAFSESKIINQGVPQGSILGPLLFCIYMNDLPDCINYALPILYADDTTVALADKSLLSLILKLNSDLSKITDWCNANFLILNPAKTQFMIFRSSQRHLPCSPAITLNRHNIPPSTCVSFLGIKLDPHLKFTNHIAHIKQKTAFGIRALLKSRAFFSKEALLSLYFAFIHSHIIYGIASWGNTYHCHLSSIQHIQNQAIRIITRSHFFSNASSQLRTNRILQVTDLFNYHLAILFFKLLTKQVSYNFVSSDLLLNPNNTRFAAEGNFLLPLCHTNYGKMASSFCAIKLWNSLPYAIKLSSTLYSFKHQLKNYLLCD